MEQRLQKILSQWGITSRRQAEEWIKAGRVRVNGQLAHLGDRADPDRDRIEYNGKWLNPQYPPDRVYLLLHKPLGVICTCHDPQGRVTILDILPKHYQETPGLHPVGRLDADSTGALILTNDGELTFCLSHPRHHIPKTYHVWVEGSPSKSALRQWRNGIPLDGQQTLNAQVNVLKKSDQPTPRTLLKIVLHEGRNRQIRRIAQYLGYSVLALHRLAIGPIQLSCKRQGKLDVGQVRVLSNHELNQLEQTGHSKGEFPPIIG
ncbi:rRNA pseudouridine synthase [Candidatus Synechococcus calcipolaris G9]|uniref:Pseudouridine synthase n=1 Tax=Candidatus Synechococcus calcipolaris G9 TaxID=1497997 RepID=A0ABT6F1Z7_9SYNE|nr:pseudouridine synthase [Candidatus Synechococcus calcipolaris]MDG2991871.1 rRNA pseudouridine synthase [Candidatus Synechococcus calcipolaris G9]